MPSVTRRVPTPRRSVERLARIARAAGELSAELGADAVTMEAIARRAHTSIGSVYQFYPNRDALLHAIAEQYVRDLFALLDSGDTPADVARLPLEALVDALIQPFIEFHRAHPGYFAILFAPQGMESLRRVRGRLRNVLVERMERLLQARAPRLAPARRRRMAMTAVEAARAVLQYIEIAVPTAERDALRLELHSMLVAYLRPALQREDQ